MNKNFNDYIVVDLAKVDPQLKGKFCVVRRTWYPTGEPDLYVLGKHDNWFKFTKDKVNVFRVYSSIEDAREDRKRKFEEDVAKNQAKGKLVGIDANIPLIPKKGI
jgi:hypothetical protein